jgi:hypothetical protein
LGEYKEEMDRGRGLRVDMHFLRSEEMRRNFQHGGTDAGRAPTAFASSISFLKTPY